MQTVLSPPLVGIVNQLTDFKFRQMVAREELLAITNTKFKGVLRSQSMLIALTPDSVIVTVEVMGVGR